MYLSEVKKQLGVEALPMSRVVNEKQEPTPWLANWNNDNRTRTIIHEDLLSDIQSEAMLFLKTSQETAEVSGKPYTLHIICRSNDKPEVIL